MVRLSLKQVRRTPAKYAKPFWVYFYGGPETEDGLGAQLSGFFSKMFAPDELSKGMNLGRVPGCFYRGRALISVAARPTSEEVKIETGAGRHNMDYPPKRWP